MRALLSVYDKTGLVPFARGLAALGFELVSTGGTLTALEREGIPARAVQDVTGFPEMLDGRVKTLHPVIHGGLLARRDDPEHLRQIAEHAIAPIDLVAVNLYPFAATVADPKVADADAIEQIDIGGPAMLRSAAKNHPGVLVVSSPDDYAPVLAALEAGTVDAALRRSLAAKAFAHTAAYDATVAAYLTGPLPEIWPAEISVAGQLTETLRYGENPHQRAAAYRRLIPGAAPKGVLDAVQLSGKELSFNNLLDADAAWAALRPFDDGPAVAIIKHTIPCGLAVRDNPLAAYQAALAGDPVSAFGGIVAINRPVADDLADAIAGHFFEVILAPAFSEGARERLGRKKALRLLKMPESANAIRVWDLRAIAGGLLVQEPDDQAADYSTWRVVSQRQPTGIELDGLRFAWNAVRAVKSNGIVLASDRAIVGVGSGQPNRVESVRIAVRGAGERAAGSVLGSDAFFPFADGLEAAAAAGVTAAVQPGGSMRDAEVIAAADAAGMALVFTGVRHFRH